jgi:hypothetical protein
MFGESLLCAWSSGSTFENLDETPELFLFDQVDDLLPHITLPTTPFNVASFSLLGIDHSALESCESPIGRSSSPSWDVSLLLSVSSSSPPVSFNGASSPSTSLPPQSVKVTPQSIKRHRDELLPSHLPPANKRAHCSKTAASPPATSTKHQKRRRKPSLAKSLIARQRARNAQGQFVRVRNDTQDYLSLTSALSLPCSDCPASTNPFLPYDTLQR